MEDDFEHFFYSQSDYHFNISDGYEDSNFDKTLKTKWNVIENSGALRYSIKSLESRVLEGKYGFFMQVIEINQGVKQWSIAQKILFHYFLF